MGLEDAVVEEVLDGGGASGAGGVMVEEGVMVGENVNTLFSESTSS